MPSLHCLLLVFLLLAVPATARGPPVPREDSPSAPPPAASSVLIQAARSAIAAALSYTRSATTLLPPSPGQPGPDQDCAALLAHSAKQLAQAATKMRFLRRGAARKLQLDDIMTWASAALTDLDMCLTSVLLMTPGSARDALARSVDDGLRTTRNALYFISRLGSP